jgi:hypothetical protein
VHITLSIEEIKKINSALEIISNAESKFAEIWGPLKNILQYAKDTLGDLESQKEELERIKEEQASQIVGLSDKQRELLKEYETVKVELEKFTRMAGTEGEVKLADMQATLAIYRVLIEQIWQSQPHFRVLLLLHGDSDELELDHIKGATGISGAMILHACHELDKVNLITFDPETKKAKLVRRLFPKRQDQVKK